LAQHKHWIVHNNDQYRHERIVEMNYKTNNGSKIRLSCAYLNRNRQGGWKWWCAVSLLTPFFWFKWCRGAKYENLCLKIHSINNTALQAGRINTGLYLTDLCWNDHFVFISTKTRKITNFFNETFSKPIGAYIIIRIIFRISYWYAPVHLRLLRNMRRFAGVILLRSQMRWFCIENYIFSCYYYVKERNTPLGFVQSLI
jgi:hypothetical protein